MNVLGRLRSIFDLVVVVVLETTALPILTLLAFFSRFARRPVDVGIGPDPLINNPFHKQALERHGYVAETFVRTTWHVTTAFDFRADEHVRTGLVPYYMFVRALFRYRCIYVYFTGGPLGETRWLWRWEAWFYKLAQLHVVVMPFGSDVADLVRTTNLLLKNGYSRDYPHHRFRRRKIAEQIDLWTEGASHVIGGCDWVEYLHHWDTLMLAHFAIDPDRWRPPTEPRAPGPVRIFHAPNHRTLKGTEFFVRAVNELRAEGVDVELVIAERVPNTEIQKLMASVDVVADQLIVGWYAMFALEGLMMEKPVLCFLRPDLEELYVTAGLVERGEIPLIRCSPATVKETIRALVRDRDQIPEIGRRSRAFAIKHHSVDSVGRVFAKINASFGLESRARPAAAGAKAAAPMVTTGADVA